jgi:hypothetical protein
VSSQLYAIIRSGKASYLELQERLSVEDAFNLLEVLSVENHNERAWRQFLER